MTGLSSVIHDKPYLKSSTSVLSLASEELIDVSAQNKSVTLLLPKQIIFVSSAPQIRFPDCYGIDMSRLDNLVAFKA